MPDRIFNPPPGWKPLDRQTTERGIIAQLMHLSSRPSWLYRGEPRVFPEGLTSLGRFLRKDAPNPVAAECQTINWFVHRAYQHLRDSEHRIMDNMIGVLTIMQHHGAPTRLLDWSKSVWVAAYHSASNDPDEDGLLWSYDARAYWKNVPEKAWQSVLEDLMHAKDSKSYGKAAEACVEALGPSGIIQCTDRMVAQQGVFTFGNPARIDHREMIGRAFLEDTDSAMVMVVPKETKRPLMRILHAMNITAAALFPGINGAGRTVREIAQYAIAVD
ncbi:MAG: FRG domain-containing protein [Phycisphaerales bacterium]|nr:FRG domain-containing protein [Phycisphaerales bacterium]